MLSKRETVLKTFFISLSYYYNSIPLWLTSFGGFKIEEQPGLEIHLSIKGHSLSKSQS